METGFESSVNSLAYKTSRASFHAKRMFESSVNYLRVVLCNFICFIRYSID